MEENIFNLKLIEDAIRKGGLPKYPKYIGNNLWQLSDNCIAGEEGLNSFDKAVLMQLKEGYEEIRNETSSIKIFDKDRLKPFDELFKDEEKF